MTEKIGPFQLMAIGFAAEAEFEAKKKQILGI
jgi:hypothetical protein